VRGWQLENPNAGITFAVPECTEEGTSLIHGRHFLECSKQYDSDQLFQTIYVCPVGSTEENRKEICIPPVDCGHCDDSTMDETHRYFSIDGPAWDNLSSPNVKAIFLAWYFSAKYSKVISNPQVQLRT